MAGGIEDGTSTAQQFTYDAYGNPATVEDANGNTTTTEFDDFYHSFPITITYANGSQTVTRYDYTLDVPNVMTDVNGLVTHHTSDTFGRPSTTWQEGFGTSTTPNERYHFRDLGQSAVTVPFSISYQLLLTGTTTTWQTRWFDGRGRPIEDVSPKDGTYSIVTNMTYTDTGVISSTTLPYLVPNSDPFAYLTPVANQPQIVKYYDPLGRTSRVLNPDGTAITYDYSFLQWVGTQDESGHEKWQHTDLLGRMDEVLEQDTTGYGPGTVYTLYTFDLLDHLTETTRDAGGTNATSSTISYNGLGRKSQIIDPDTGTSKFRYDAVGNVISQTDALYLSDPTTYADHELLFAYDNMNRIQYKYYGLAHYSAVPDVQYYYDDDLGDAATAHSWGRLRYAEVTLQGQGADKANGHGYTYDLRGLAAAEAITTTYTSRTYVITSTFDLAGRPTSLTYPDPEAVHEVVTTTYNSQKIGLPQQLTSSLGGSLPVLAADYNARGQMTTLYQGTNLLHSDLLTTSYTYDDATTQRGWLTRLQVIGPNPLLGSVTFLDLSLGYYANGNVYTTTQAAGGTSTNPTFTNTYAYDGLDRLRSATSTSSLPSGYLFPQETYSYDTLGRIYTRTVGANSYTYSYGDAAHKDAPTGYNSESYTYDANGGQTSRTGGSRLAQTRGFDSEGRLAGIEQVNGSGTTTSTFVYDGNGSRVLKTVDNFDGGSTHIITRTVYVGGVYEETVSNGSTPPYTAYYLFGGRMVGLRRANGANNGLFRLVGDHLGGTNLLINTVLGVPQRQYYTPYGEIAWQHLSSSALTDIGFTGQRLDADDGLMYYGARFYDPVLSHFVSADTIAPDPANPQSRQRYSYVRNNPLRYTDPTGHNPEGRCPDNEEGCSTVPPTHDDYVEELRKLGIDVLEGASCAEEGCLAFTTADLKDMLDGIHRLMDKAGWDLDAFKTALHITSKTRITFMMVAETCGSGCTNPDGSGVKFTRSIFDADHANGEVGSLTIAAITVHELAHVWDLRDEKRLSQGMYDATHYVDEESGATRSRGTPAGAYGYGGQLEDWAVSVESVVFADTALHKPGANDHYPYYDANSERSKYVQDEFACAADHWCR